MCIYITQISRIYSQLNVPHPNGEHFHHVVRGQLVTWINIRDPGYTKNHTYNDEWWYATRIKSQGVIFFKWQNLHKSSNFSFLVSASRFRLKMGLALSSLACKKFQEMGLKNSCKKWNILVQILNRSENLRCCRGKNGSKILKI